MIDDIMGGSANPSILTLTPQQLVCEFQSVSTITEPIATLVPLATFTIPVDQVKLVQSQPPV
jgi:hypothetical protein